MCQQDSDIMMLMDYLTAEEQRTVLLLLSKAKREYIAQRDANREFALAAQQERSYRSVGV